MAIVEYGVVLAIGLLDLVEALGDQEGPHAVARQEGQAGLEEVQPAERGKLVEHQEEPVTLGFCVIAAASVQPLCQAPPDLVQDQADQRLGAADVRGRYHQVQRDRVRGFRSEEHTSELQSLMRNSYAVFCLKKTNK